MRKLAGYRRFRPEVTQTRASRTDPRRRGEPVTVRPLHEGAELLFAGDIFCDVVFAGVEAPEVGAEVYAEAFTITAGGVANRAVAAARAGATTMVLSRLGDDPLGEHVHALLDAEPGLDTRLLERVPGHQSPVT